VFGRIGDQLGRKPALLISIWLMALSTCGIGLIPDYDTIGGPILLLLNLRIFQGISCGGELIGSMIFVVEHAPRAQRRFYGSFVEAGLMSGLLLASLVAWLIHTSFSDAVVTAWAWRLPFLLGILIGLIGWFIRRSVPETQLFKESIRLPDHYLKRYREYTNYAPNALLIIGMMLFSCVLSYLIYVFLITYMSNTLHYTMRQALSVNIVSITLLVLLMPWIGKLSGRIGRRPVMGLALMGGIVWKWPYFLLIQQNLAVALLAQLVMTLFAAAYFASSVITIVEMIPVHMRFSIVAFTYAIAVTLFGSMTPFIALLLVKTKYYSFSLALYLTVCALISSIAVYKVRETRCKANADEKNNNYRSGNKDIKGGITAVAEQLRQ